VDAEHWDRRYDQTGLVWSAEPNRWVEEVAAALPPGRVLDLACGEGRNALWLAERGWRAVGVDFSRVAVDRAVELATVRLGVAADRFEGVCADLLEFEPEPRAFDLVLVVYLQLRPAERTTVLRRAAAAVADGGLLFVAAHDSANLEDGYGGPQEPAVLYTAADVVADIGGGGLVVDRAERVVRPVATDEGERHALDCLVLAHRPPG